MGTFAIAITVIASLLAAIGASSLIAARRAGTRLRRGAHLVHTARGQVEYAMVGSGPPSSCCTGAWGDGIRR